MSITAPNYVQGQYSVADRDRIFAKADKYPDASGGITNQVPTLAADGSIIWRQQSSGGGDGTANANIAVVEDTSTASQAYAVGDLLVYSGQLYRVTADIAQGGTITPGTNVTPTTVADELENGGGGGGGVTSFNSRTGAVLPQAADYPPSLIGAAAASDIAPAEVSPATAAHAENSFMIYNGQLYRVTAAIAVNDALTVGTNIAAEDVGSYISRISSEVAISGITTEAQLESVFDSIIATMSDNTFKFVTLAIGTNFVADIASRHLCRIFRATATYAKVEMSTYSPKGNHVKNKVNGTWEGIEYVNPPLVADTEYRTTERFLGKPVYVKAVSLTSLPTEPNTSADSGSLAITNFGNLLDGAIIFDASASGKSYQFRAPYTDANGNTFNGGVYAVNGIPHAVLWYSNSSATVTGATAILKYTKTTD